MSDITIFAFLYAALQENYVLCLPCLKWQVKITLVHIMGGKTRDEFLIIHALFFW